ncbi:MAG: hypothetical protein MO846_11375 [Candidatus Devosia symbiotica]|nr:hypothetical protein [Candidatus Devosia symbiotica]
MIDNASLLVAIAFSSAALMIAMLINWLNARNDSYLINWATNMAFVIASPAVLGLRNDRYDIPLQITVFSPLLTGMALIQLGIYRLLGYSGPATVLLNVWCAMFMASSG